MCCGIRCELGWISSAISQTQHFFQGCTLGLEGSVPFVMNPLKIVCWFCFARFVCFVFLCSVFPIAIVTRAVSFAAGISPKMHPSQVEICESETSRVNGVARTFSQLCMSTSQLTSLQNHRGINLDAKSSTMHTFLCSSD